MPKLRCCLCKSDVTLRTPDLVASGPYVWKACGHVYHVACIEKSREQQLKDHHKKLRKRYGRYWQDYYDEDDDRELTTGKCPNCSAGADNDFDDYRAKYGDYKNIFDLSSLCLIIESIKVEAKQDVGKIELAEWTPALLKLADLAGEYGMDLDYLIRNGATDSGPVKDVLTRECVDA